MAGIGFVLKRVVAEETYSSVFKGYLSAAIISSGPWFMAVFTLALLGIVSSGFLPAEEKSLFFSAITYSFAFSLIMTGFLQMPATRYAADLLYLGRLERVTSALMSLLLVTLPFQMASMAIVFAVSGTGVAYAVAVGSMYAAVSGIWLTMIFLSAAKDYDAIVRAFLLGYVASFGGTFLFGTLWGPLGAVAGFAIGQTLTLVMLWGRVLVEFGPPSELDFTVFLYLGRFPSLVAIGFLYNFGVWIDKMLFWFSKEGVQIKGLVHVFPMFDTTTFLAFLTAAPAMALFLTQVETGFYLRYKSFYKKLTDKASFQEVAEEKRLMGRAMMTSFAGLLRLQFLVSAMALVFAPQILDGLNLSEAHLFMFRLNILSVALHVFMSISLLLLLYFDMRGSVVRVLGVFAVTNIGATVWTIHLGYQWYGFGFLIAEAVATVMVIGALANRFRNLEYLTFVRQPITEPERARAALPAQLTQRLGRPGLPRPAEAKTGPPAGPGR